MMTKKIRAWAVIFLISALVITSVSTWFYSSKKGEGEGVAESLPIPGIGQSIHLWYGDEELTDFLTNAAAAYFEETGVTVIPELHNEAGYLENIYDASVKNDDVPLPDLYILANDSLEKAYISGLAEGLGRDFLTPANFPSTALNAVSCDGNYIGYPLYFETTVLLYNKTYMERACISAAEREDAETVGQVTEVDDNEGDITVDPLTYEDALNAGYTLDSVMPSTVSGILEFADTYDAPMDVESVFKWDVTDIFYNYYFPGSYMDVGGVAGDDPDIVDIDNENVRKCMEMYQTLNQFFSIDTNAVTYQSILDEFIQGKIVMTVATSDCIRRMESAIAEGEFDKEYDTAMIPGITEELDSRSLSVTTAVVVNGFSDKKSICKDFSEFLVKKRSDLLYEEAGKIPALVGASLPNPKLKPFVEEYSYSVSMPKLLGASNFWVQLEICCAKIWDGEDVGELLSELQSRMDEEIRG